MAVNKRISKAERQARAAVGRAHPFVACVNCADGWIHVDHGARDGWRSQSASRCQCWYVHQRRVAQLVRESLEAGARP